MRRFAFLLPILFLAACLPPRETVGWNPATMTCQVFDGERFTGPFLPSDRCAGLEKPTTIE